MPIRTAVLLLLGLPLMAAALGTAAYLWLASCDSDATLPINSSPAIDTLQQPAAFTPSIPIAP